MDLIDRQAAIEVVKHAWAKGLEPTQYLEELPAVQTCDDAVSRQQAIVAVGYYSLHSGDKLLFADKPLKDLPAVQPEQRYTEEELRVFAHGISLSLLSKRSAQHWRYDKDTATEIEFLERLYDKVSADMKGEQ